MLYLERVDGFSGNVAQFYSIRFKGAGRSEFADFLNRFHSNKLITNEYNEIIYWLEQISKLGAESRHFRNELSAVALPPNEPRRPERRHHLRLYAYRVSRNLVLLFNGDIKTPGIRKAQNCPVVGPYFKNAQKFVTAFRNKITQDTSFLLPDLTDFSASNQHLLL